MPEKTHTSPVGRPCVFLDRDGTLNVDVGYAHRPDQLELLPGVPEGLAALREAGLLLVVVTNQSGVARGFYDEPAISRFHRYLDRELGPAAAPDAYYYCPYHVEATDPAYRQDSALRKPNIGMFERARDELGIDARRSYMIGDSDGDMLFARRAGLRAILLASARPDDAVAAGRTPPVHLVCDSFREAANAILAHHLYGQDAWPHDRADPPG